MVVVVVVVVVVVMVVMVVMVVVVMVVCCFGNLTHVLTLIKFKHLEIYQFNEEEAYWIRLFIGIAVYFYRLRCVLHLLTLYCPGMYFHSKRPALE